MKRMENEPFSVRQNSGQTEGQKEILPQIAAVFFGVLLLLTFFSKTLNNMGLPRVEAVEPVSGSLIWEIIGEEAVEARKKGYVYAELNRQLKEILVQEGEAVKKGQLLAVTNSEEFADILTDKLLLYKSGKLTLTELSELLIYDNTVFEKKKLNLIQEKVQRMTERVSVKKILYEKGAIPKEDLRRAEEELRLARMELIDIERELAEKIQANKKELGKTLLVAPMAGVITGINFTEKMLVDKTQPVIIIADAREGFVLRKKVAAKQGENLCIGDRVKVRLKSGRELQGELLRIRNLPAEDIEEQELIIALPPDQALSEGVKVKISIVKRSEFFPVLVPNAAVCRDEKGDFLWVLQEKTGPLGREYYVVKTQVTIADSDNEKTAIIGGLNPGARVAISSKPLTNGARVCLE